MKATEPVTFKNIKRTDFSTLMEIRIKKILMICSSYDAYILEEDGQIEALLYKEYNDLNLTTPPKLTWVNSSQEANELMKEVGDFDLIICMFNMRDMDLFAYAQQIKEEGLNIPFVLLTNYSKELFKKIYEKDHSAIDYIFTWTGNADLILAIIKLIEDSKNAHNDILKSGVQCILLVEDNIRFYSTYLPAIYKLVLKQSAEFLNEALNEQQMKIRKRARPKILLCTNYEDALVAYQTYKKNMLGVISDVGFVMGKNDPPEMERLDAGIKLCQLIKDDNPYMPILLQSSQESISEVAKEMGIGFLKKTSKTLLIKLSRYISEEFAFGDFVVKDPGTGEIIARAKNLREFQSLIREIPDELLEYYASINRFSKWMFSRGLFTIANRIRDAKTSNFGSVSHMREYILQHIKDYRILSGQGIIAGFDENTYNKYIWFAKMGEGSLGGKARGLAFLNNMIIRYDLFSRYKGLKVSIPRSIVIATDYFDEFIEDNGLQYVIDADISDEEILSEFISSRLPERLVDKLRIFVDTVSTPLAVRSSSKLEDSQFQPFAGIYSTYMIPYTDNNDQMLRLLGKAVKSVYASVFYAASRSYIQTTANLLSEEKMAVIIQGICGSEDSGYYYPTISGVARSINEYPIGGESADDGVVNLAYGLGKIVVEGGKTLRFSPKYPKKILQLSTLDLALKETQGTMYALNLKPEEFKTSIDDGVNLQSFTIQEASIFDDISSVASTFDVENQRLIPNTTVPGRRIITFASILEYDTLPLADLLSDLLEICKKELRCNVEIEFAVDMDEPDGKDKYFNILQVRPIPEHIEEKYYDMSSLSPEKEIIYSESALGSGIIEGVTEIIYVREENFDKSFTKEIALEIGKLNKQMAEEGLNYVLVGPGRWGSSDQWLGIPTTWDQISEARVIVECGTRELHTDPSQGTHFFQNITSLGIGYFTISPYLNDGRFAKERLDSMPSSYQSEFLRRVSFEKPLTILVDRDKNIGIVTTEEIDD